MPLNGFSNDDENDNQDDDDKDDNEEELAAFIVKHIDLHRKTRRPILTQRLIFKSL